MQVTEVTMGALDQMGRSDRTQLAGVGSITLDGTLVIRGCRILQPPGRAAYAIMPSQWTEDLCQRECQPGGPCNGWNRLEARYCQWCGGELDPTRGERGPDGKRRLSNYTVFARDHDMRQELCKPLLAAYEAAVKSGGHVRFRWDGERLCPIDKSEGGFIVGYDPQEPRPD